jgi:predicted HTH transcriptional regulator
LDLIKQDNTLTAVDISQQLHISLSTAKRRLKALKEKGLLDRVGSDKTGVWRLL